MLRFLWLYQGFMLDSCDLFTQFARGYISEVIWTLCKTETRRNIWETAKIKSEAECIVYPLVQIIMEHASHCLMVHIYI